MVQAVTFQTVMINGQMQIQPFLDNRTFHPCQPNDAKSIGDYNWISDHFCLDNDSFAMVGGIGEMPSSHLEVHVMMCQNETYNNKCRTIDEINSYFETTSISLVYVTNVFQTNNYSTPITERPMKSLYKLEARFNRLVTVSLQKATLITDEMILLSNNKNRETYVYETESTELGVSSSVASPIASFLFISSNNHLTVTRVYQSLTEAAAVVGGLFSFLVMLGKVLSEVDKSIYITTELMNFLYSFPEQKPFFMKQNAFKTTTTATAEIQLLEGKEEDFRSESPKGINVLSIRSNKQIEGENIMLKICGDSPKSTQSIKKQRRKSTGHIEPQHIEGLIGDQADASEHYSKSDEKNDGKSPQHLQIPENRPQKNRV